MDVTKELTAYYSTYDEDGRLRSRHGMVEHLTTMRYIAKYLRPGIRILEIGAGTGRYSHALAQQGYRVDAVELCSTTLIFSGSTCNITFPSVNAAIWSALPIIYWTCFGKMMKMSLRNLSNYGKIPSINQ